MDSIIQVVLKRRKEPRLALVVIVKAKMKLLKDSGKSLKLSLHSSKRVTNKATKRLNISQD